MVRWRSFLGVLLVAIATNLAALAAEIEQQMAGYQVIEVALFTVDRESYASKQAERAGSIPDETLEAIQRAILGELTRSHLAIARQPTEETTEPGRCLLLSGRVTDFKPGNRAARYIVGFGAGKQLIEVECVLADKATGQLVSAGRVIDRKVGGWAGGSELKGVEDFAQKVLHFVKEALPLKAKK